MLPTLDSNEPAGLPNKGEQLALGKLAREKDGVVVEEKDLIPDVVRSEVNFLVLPFFALWDKDVKMRTKTEYKAVVKRGKQKLEVSWTVSSNSEFGYPGPFDKKVHKAIEQIISGLPRPIPYLIPLGSFYHLCKKMGIEKYGGTHYRKIKESLKRITTTSIETKGAFYSKNEEEWMEDVFHLYERVIFKGRKLPSGGIADTNYLIINSWYLDNINANYVKPLDWDYYNSLKTPLAQRFYELLSVKFYGVLMRRGKELTYKYSTLCDLLPTKRQKYLSVAKRILDPAHKKLKETGFLADWDWDDTSPKSKGDWLIIYYPGKRAIKEIKEAQTFFKSPPLEVEYLLEPELEEKPAKPKRKQMPVEHPDEIEAEATLSPMTQELVNRGITKAVALDFAQHLPEEHLREKIQLHDYKKERGEITTNAAGWLREAIVRNYKPSEQQLKKKAQVDKRKAQQEELRTVEEKAREIQEQRLLEALQTFPEAEQWVRERVVEHVNVRQMTIKAFGGEQFSAAEIEAMYLDFQAQVPKTLEEKRAWLISNYKEYALSTIISALREEQQQSLKESEATAQQQAQAPFNSIEAVLGEVARQRAEFEATQKRRENAVEPEADEDDD